MASQILTKHFQIPRWHHKRIPNKHRKVSQFVNTIHCKELELHSTVRHIKMRETSHHCVVALQQSLLCDLPNVMVNEVIRRNITLNMRTHPTQDETISGKSSQSHANSSGGCTSTLTSSSLPKLSFTTDEWLAVVRDVVKERSGSAQTPQQHESCTSEPPIAAARDVILSRSSVVAAQHRALACVFDLLNVGMRGWLGQRVELRAGGGDEGDSTETNVEAPLIHLLPQSSFVVPLPGADESSSTQPFVQSCIPTAEGAVGEIGAAEQSHSTSTAGPDCKLNALNQRNAIYHFSVRKFCSLLLKARVLVGEERGAGSHFRFAKEGDILCDTQSAFLSRQVLFTGVQAAAVWLRECHACFEEYLGPLFADDVATANFVSPSSPNLSSPVSSTILAQFTANVAKCHQWIRRMVASRVGNDGTDGCPRVNRYISGWVFWDDSATEGLVDTKLVMNNNNKASNNKNSSRRVVLVPEGLRSMLQVCLGCLRTHVAASTLPPTSSSAVSRIWKTHPLAFLANAVDAPFVDVHKAPRALFVKILNGFMFHPLLPLLTHPSLPREASALSRAGMGDGYNLSFYDNQRVISTSVVHNEWIQQHKLVMMRKEGIVCEYYEAVANAVVSRSNRFRSAKGSKYLKRLKALSQKGAAEALWNTYGSDEDGEDATDGGDSGKSLFHFRKNLPEMEPFDLDEDVDEEYTMGVSGTSPANQRFVLISQAFRVVDVMLTATPALDADADDSALCFLLQPISDDLGAAQGSAWRKESVRCADRFAITMRADGTVSRFEKCEDDQCRGAKLNLAAPRILVKWDPLVIVCPVFTGGAGNDEDVAKQQKDTASASDLDHAHEANGTTRNQKGKGSPTRRNISFPEGKPLDGIQLRKTETPTKGSSSAGQPADMISSRPASVPPPKPAPRQPSPDSLLKAAMRAGRTPQRGATSSGGGAGGSHMGGGSLLGATSGGLLIPIGRLCERGSSASETSCQLGKGAWLVHTSLLNSSHRRFSLYANHNESYGLSNHPSLDRWGVGPMVIDHKLREHDPYFTNALAAMGSAISDTSKERGRAAAAQRMLRQHQRQQEQQQQAAITAASDSFAGGQANSPSRRKRGGRGGASGTVTVVVKENDLDERAPGEGKCEVPSNIALDFHANERESSSAVTQPAPPMSDVLGIDVVASPSRGDDAETAAVDDSLSHMHAQHHPHHRQHQPHLVMVGAVLGTFELLSDLFLFTAALDANGPATASSSLQSASASAIFVAASSIILSHYAPLIIKSMHMMTLIERRGGGENGPPSMTAGVTVSQTHSPSVITTSLLDAAAGKGWRLMWRSLSETVKVLIESNDQLEAHWSVDRAVAVDLMGHMERYAFVIMLLYSITLLPTCAATITMPSTSISRANSNTPATHTAPFLVALPYCAAFAQSIGELSLVVDDLIAQVDASTKTPLTFLAYRALSSTGTVVMSRVWPNYYQPHALLDVLLDRGEPLLPSRKHEATDLPERKLSLKSAKRPRSTEEGPVDEGCSSRTVTNMFITRDGAALQLFADLLLRRGGEGTM